MGGARFGVMGLAVMGANLARNVASRGVPVAVYNRTGARTDAFIAEHGREGGFTPAKTIPEFVAAIERPRAILVMVKAGSPVDEAIAEIWPHPEQGDILVGSGTSSSEDPRRRCRELEDRGFRYLGTGVSGGEEGALKGPSIMPGGTAEAYAQVEEVLTSIAADVE